MTARVSYTLKQPVARAGAGKPDAGADPEMLTTVSVRSPTVRDLRVTDAHRGEVAKGAALLAQVTDLDLKTVDQLDASDFEALSNILGDFYSTEKVG